MSIYQRKYSNIELKISADVLHGVSSNRFDVGSDYEDANTVTADASGAAIDPQSIAGDQAGPLLTNRTRGASWAANLPSTIS
jgi:hypothetical protein